MKSSRKNTVKCIELVTAIIVAAIIIMSFANTKKNFEEFALGEGTSAHFAYSKGFPIHLDRISKDLIDSLKLGWQSRGENEVCLILGNSQTHAINQYKPGQTTYNALLFDAFQGQTEILTLSIPNVTLQEMYLSYQFLKEYLPVKQIVLPAFLDDTRNDGLKSTMFSYLKRRHFALEGGHAIDKKINEEILKIPLGESDANYDALVNTDQERVEKKLNNFLNEHSRSWKNRPTIRGKVFTALYNLRNTVFGIKSLFQKGNNIGPLRHQYGGTGSAH